MYIESSDGGTVHWWTPLGPAGKPQTGAPIQRRLEQDHRRGSREHDADTRRAIDRTAATAVVQAGSSSFAVEAGDMRVVIDGWSADVDGGRVVEDALFFGVSVKADHGAPAAGVGGAGAATACRGRGRMIRCRPANVEQAAAVLPAGCWRSACAPAKLAKNPTRMVCSSSQHWLTTLQHHGRWCPGYVKPPGVVAEGPDPDAAKQPPADE